MYVSGSAAWGAGAGGEGSGFGDGEGVGEGDAVSVGVGAGTWVGDGVGAPLGEGDSDGDAIRAAGGDVVCRAGSLSSGQPATMNETAHNAKIPVTNAHRFIINFLPMLEFETIHRRRSRVPAMRDLPHWLELAALGAA